MAQLLGVPPPSLPRDPSLAAPLAVVRSFRPYYSPLELDHLVHLQATQRAHPDDHAQQQGAGGAAAPAGRKVMSEHRIDTYRQLACGFIERVGGRLGFPRRTIATAQKLYHRFHLHFPLNDFAYQDVSLSALLVASKLEDTLKKLRDIQIAAWQVLNMMDGGEGRGEGDLSAQEAHRPHLIGIERLILQTISFNFNLHRSLSPSSSSSSLSSLSSEALLALATPPPTRDAFTHLLRLSSALPSLPLPLCPAGSTAQQQEAARKTLTFLAFLLLTDLHRTLAPLSYPPHTCAAACLWAAGFLLAAGARDVGAREGEVWDEEMRSSWAGEAESEGVDIDDIAQTLLNLLISLCPTPSAPSTSSVQTSPLFSPSQASPSEPVAPSAATVSTKAVLSERDRHLLAAGVPNAFSHPSAVPSSASAGGGGTGGWMSPDRLTSVKIALRTSSLASSTSSTSSSKRPAPDAPLPDELERAERWASLPSGLLEVARLRDERDERDRLRAEEREEREREKAEAQAALEGGETVSRAASRARTEEERERERRERRERGKPGSVRYRF
ncbi:hypothetical protein JCM10213_002397 [Rhodosporidiobolus nylandii]